MSSALSADQREARDVLVERMNEAFAYQQLMAIRHSKESGEAAKMVWDACMAVTRFDHPEDTDEPIR